MQSVNATFRRVREELFGEEIAGLMNQSKKFVKSTFV